MVSALQAAVKSCPDWFIACTAAVMALERLLDLGAGSEPRTPLRSGQASTVKRASNCLTIDRWCSPLKPIERGEPVVVSCAGIGPVIEKNLDRFHEAGLGGVVKGHCSPAVGPLPGEALVVDTCAVTQERRNILGVILSPLVSGARKPDPRPRSIDACPRAREHWRQLRMEDPAAPRRSTLRSLRVP